MERSKYLSVLPESVDYKHRCFSTSTPFINNSRQRNGKTSSGDLFDSGLGSSISESVINEKTSFNHTSGCTSPLSASALPAKFTVSPANVTIAHSPIFLKNINTVGSVESLDISHISFSRSRRLFRRRLNLDLDIDNDSVHQSKTETNSNHQHELINVTLADDLHTISVVQAGERESAPLSAAPVEQKNVELDRLLETYLPLEKDRLIGRKIGLTQVDILKELNDRNITCSSVLSYLEPEDFCSMCMVSRTWKAICEGDPQANQRRQKYIKQCKRNRRKMCKENASGKLPRPQSQQLTTGSQVLAVVQPTGMVPLKPEPDRGKTTTEQFLEAAKALKKDEKLHKCPRCHKPAKVPPVQERGKCQNSDCKFDYCIKCLGQFHGSKPCVPIGSKRTKTVSIGTKQSKKNLKRL